MENTAGSQALKKAQIEARVGHGLAAVAPNPKLKLLDQVR